MGQPAELFVVLVRPAASWRDNRGGARLVECAVSRHHQRRRSTAPARHERCDDGEVPRQTDRGRARRPGPEPDPRFRAHTAPDAARRHRFRAAHCLRQHRQSTARAIRGASQRNGGPPVDRRQPLAVDRTALDRIAAPRGPRRPRRPCRRALDVETDPVADAGAGGPVDGVHAQHAGAALRRRADDRNRAALRALSCAAQHTARSRVHLEGTRGPAFRRARCRASVWHWPLRKSRSR